MRKSNSSILGKYSDGSNKKKGSKDSGIVEYRQLYKGEISAKNVTEKKVQTLEDKIAARDYRANDDKKKDEESAQITIGGISYIVRSEDASPDRIRKVGDLADEIYKETRDNNPYIASLKTAIMSLFEACDRLITLRAENNALKTELMYYKQKDKLNEEKEKKPDPTPMEKLAESSSIGKSILFSHLKDNEKKD
ncbi:MAG: cell division protein ZapA [Clostridiales bacterium]|jgi:cell division protein ZapA (FtsZ GTPase activity inhibitor)|nr:cell division protein ZapA [Clostridiales bacterium]